MSALPQPPGPGPPSPQQSRRGPRKLAKAPPAPRNEGSAGGVLLPTSTAASVAQTPDAGTPTRPSRRRRPRKLNRDQPDTAAASGPSPEAGGIANNELEALKSRVRGLESKVEELYKTSRLVRSPRRRGKGRKNSSQVGMAAGGTGVGNEMAADAGVGAGAGETEGEEAELRRLENELEMARLDLANASSPTRPRVGRRVTSVDGDVEELPRIESPAVEEDGAGRDGKAVTLSGSYRIPLPASVSMADVKSIQNGISSAQSVARSFLDARKEKEKEKGGDRPKRPRRRNSATASGDVQEGGQSWGEWFGAYSMSISRAVQSIEADMAIEAAGQKNAPRRPVAGPRKASAPGNGIGVVEKSGTAAAASGFGAMAGRGDAGKGGKGGNEATRPPLKPRASNAAIARMSGEQVKTLMS
ncbi:hypothetical protein K432DRAFT_381950 [Lepidopterella palustris CBS 459.81]|uniref:Uncharacterized protein n=1 Tax=Lepidopterella palustris CBS 459.81 TaxID=1314670 RepID=A0A8E2EB12_9PEZI|nr:hypothetical protein K432DRAFT_381950 [Lepidopterella palustris CBS 459.81]